MLIDCDTCAVRDVACHDCVVGVLLGTPEVPSHETAPGAVHATGDPQPGGPLPLEFGPVERRALEVLADHGLIPRLRLVPSAADAPSPSSSAASSRASSAGGPGAVSGASPRAEPRVRSGGGGRRRARDAG